MQKAHSALPATLIAASIGVLLGLANLGCKQDSSSVEMGPPPPAITLPPTTAPAPTTPYSSATTKPADAATDAETHVGAGSRVLAEPEPPPPVLPSAQVPTTLPTTEPVPELNTVPVTPPATVPALEPAAPASTAPAATTMPADAVPPDRAETRHVMGSFTGTLHGGIVAIGSETSGWALAADGATGTCDIDVTAISSEVKALEGKHVTITGVLKEKNWVERGKTQLLIAYKIALTPLPDLNK